MKQLLLFAAFFTLFSPCQGAVQVYTPTEVLVIEQLNQFDQNVEKKTMQALRQNLKKGRNAASANKERNPKYLALLGFIFSTISFLLFLRSFLFIYIPVPAIPFISWALYLGGIVFSIIALSWIKKGKIDRKYRWMPITGLILIGLVVLFYGLLLIAFL